MGTEDSGINQTTEPAKTPPDDHSEVWHYGRRLKLEFAGEDVPVLHRIEFKPRKDADPDFREQDSKKDFSWSDVPKGISIVILKYLLWAKQGRKGSVYLTGKHRDSLAASLGDAITNETGFVEVFGEVLPSGITMPRVKQIFVGENMHGKARDNRDRRIRVRESYLPPDCVSVYWDARGAKALSEQKDFQLLLEKLSKAAGIPAEPEISIGEATEAEPSTPSAPAEAPKDETFPNKKKAPQSATELLQEPKPAPPAQDESGNVLKWMMREFSQTLSVLRGDAKAKESPPKPAAPSPEPSKTELAKESGPAKPEEKIEVEKSPAPNPLTVQPSEHPPLPPIPKVLFTVPPTDGYWPDETPLLSFGDDERGHWTLQNAFEGVLILGATGSGKSTGSGATIAESFLHANFGGLVLTVKKGEAEHWRKLCARCGRENDLITIRRGGEWKLNLLAYEAQRPGEGSGLSENLVSFCRNLLKISSRHQASGSHDPVWEYAGDHLLGATFDLFLLAGMEITFDHLSQFIAAAPNNPPSTPEGWLKVPVFGNLIVRARKGAVSPEDKRLLERAEEYWFRIYPGLGQKTRSSVTLGIFSMLNAFRGRDIPALVSSETNITPEVIMAGAIVLVDLPLKELEHTGLIVQSAWKYLFQKAVERQNNAGNPNRRPVFIWEDEGQYFASEHDSHFQDTARSSRVSRVILTQNLHSFYKEFGKDGIAAADNVFGNLNTKIFHANSDPTTNVFAAQNFGSEIHHRLSISNSAPPQPRDFFDVIRQNIDPPNTTGFSFAEHWEPAVRPEEFNWLRTGGKKNDFQVDAYITWLGLSDERERHFTKVTFTQHQ
jgi:hypothetical protein